MNSPSQMTIIIIIFENKNTIDSTVGTMYRKTKHGNK